MMRRFGPFPFELVTSDAIWGDFMKIRLDASKRMALAPTFRFSFLVLAAITCFFYSAGAQTVDEVIAKNIQARGGVEKLKAVHSLRSTAKLTQGSFRAEFRQENKRADKVREEFIIQGLAQVQAYDGKTGWQISPFGGRKDPELLSQDDLKSLVVDADMDGPLMEYKEKGHKAELVGHDSMEGTDCFKIKLSMKNGDVRYYYLDSDSYLELKIEIQTTIRGALQESELYYGDYEQVNGIFYPFTIEQAQKGNSSRTQISVEKIEQNVAMEDAVFSMPTSKPASKAPAGK
jgi:Outer membrane lipoprotein-sorting protein